MAILPPSSTFFRLDLSTQIKAEINEKSNGEVLMSDLQAVMQQLETIVNEWLRNKNLRSPAFQMFLHLLISGNCLVYIPPDDEKNNLYQAKRKRNDLGMKIFRLDQYTVKRDPVGNLLEIITKETISAAAIPSNIRGLVKEKMEAENLVEEEACLYTIAIRSQEDPDFFTVQQEIEGVPVPDAGGDITFAELPFIVLRGSQEGDYGRGLVEENYGDLETAEKYTKAIKQGTLAAAKVIFMNDPNGSTDTEAIQSAENLEIIEGRKEDISTLGVDKFHDFTIASNELAKIERRLAQAFLLKSSIQRQAERVTAEEIRELAQELEDALGGLYSLIAEEFQLPLVTIALASLKKAGTIPSDLPEDAYQPVITTGLAALGRNHEQYKLRAFAQEFSAIFGERVTALYLSPEEYGKRTGTNIGIDTKGLIKTEQQVKTEQEEDFMKETAIASAPQIEAQAIAQQQK